MATPGSDRPLAPAPATSAREILRLAVPAFGALVAQPLFTLIDAAIVATLGTTSLAALGAGAQVFTTVTGLAIFLAYGTTAVVARRVGAGQVAAGISDGIEGVALGLALGVAATAGTWVLAPQLLSWIGTSPATTPEALAYLRTISLAFPFALAAMAAIGVLRGLQDTATTLWVTLAAVGTNLALAAYLVLVAGWGITGSAWATVVAEALAAASSCGSSPDVRAGTGPPYAEPLRRAGCRPRVGPLVLAHRGPARSVRPGRRGGSTPR